MEPHGAEPEADGGTPEEEGQGPGQKPISNIRLYIALYLEQNLKKPVFFTSETFWRCNDPILATPQHVG